MNIEQAVSKLYEHEINCEIRSFWDMGFIVSIGDETNGFTAIAHLVKPEEVADMLMQLAKEAYPMIDFKEEVTV